MDRLCLQYHIGSKASDMPCTFILRSFNRLHFNDIHAIPVMAVRLGIFIMKKNRQTCIPRITPAVYNKCSLVVHLNFPTMHRLINIGICMTLNYGNTLYRCT